MRDRVRGDEHLQRLLHELADAGSAGPRSAGPGFAGPGSAGPGSDLASGALRRARGRRRRRTAASTVAAALAMVTVTAGVRAGVLPGPMDRTGGTGAPAAGGWDHPRENVLLLGVDAASTPPGSASGPAGSAGGSAGGSSGSAAGWDGVRPDSIVVASIDTRTGDTLLVSLPRNLARVPFPPGSPGARDFPDGFSCLDRTQGRNTQCLLYGLWTWGQAHPGYYPGDPHPGLTATVQGVEQVTGLTLDDWLVLDLRGFARLVDAVGGVDVTITRRLPIGGDATSRTATSWLAPGRQHLDGYHALWFARSHWSSDDYDRMLRQRCLLSALARQADPGKLSGRLPAVLAALGADVRTSIPLDALGRWLGLAERIRSGQVRSLVLTDQVIDPARPDVGLIRRLVRSGLAGPGQVGSGRVGSGQGTADAGAPVGSGSGGAGGSPSGAGRAGAAGGAASGAGGGGGAADGAGAGGGAVQDTGSVCQG